MIAEERERHRSEDEKHELSKGEKDKTELPETPEGDGSYTFKEAVTLILLGLPVSLWLVFTVLFIAALAISLTRGVVVAPLLEYLFGA